MIRSLVRLGLASAFCLVFALGCSVSSADLGGSGGGGNDSGGGFGGTEATATGTTTEPASGNQSGGNGSDTDPKTSGDISAPEPECPNLVPPVTFFMSADDSNSMASPAIARELLNQGLAPNPAQIRTYEFLNYYDARYDIPAMADAELGVHLDLQDLGAPAKGDPHHYRLQVGVQAFDVPRVPLVVTYVIDTSGSLVGTGLERERAALLAIASHLQAGDLVNVVTWSTKENVLLEAYVATGTPDDEAKLDEVTAKLVPGGGSDLHAGLVKGYELANEHFDVKKLNRVVLLSDGGANIGVLDRDEIAGAAEMAQDEGIYLVGVGVGPAAGYSDALMDLVTDAGRGAYVYLDSPEEAARVFDDRFDEVMNVAARNVRVEVDLPVFLDIEHFYGEEYSPVKDTIEPQNLAPGDSMVFNETLYVNSHSQVCADGRIGVRVTWETPLAHEERKVELPPVGLFALLDQPISPQMRKANAVIAYAEALKTGAAAELAAALQTVNQAIADAPEKDEDLDAIAGLLAKHPALSQK